ncbi:MAG: hypothetical protein NZ700_11235 [Gemmataceae bacterium]|nr:hypothetical protein [Gemmataceae bacterium]MDW8266402.1 hypothetical protein [Gemmataceae bacterium]
MRLFGLIFIVLLTVAGVGLYRGWFTVSTTEKDGNTHIEIVIHHAQLEADEEAVRRAWSGSREKSQENRTP